MTVKRYLIPMFYANIRKHNVKESLFNPKGKPAKRREYP